LIKSAKPSLPTSPKKADTARSNAKNSKVTQSYPNFFVLAKQHAQI
jgi:hypothetical protein